jgi:glycosyl transferase family 61
MRPAQATSPGLTLHVTVEQCSGSVQHYFHFLLGFFVPLVDELSTTWSGRPVDEVLVRSCGPFDRVIAELGDPRIRVLDPEQHRQLARAATAPLNAVTIRGRDDPAAYDRATFGRVRDALRRLREVQDETRLAEEAWRRDDARILLVERGPSPPFYESQQSEVKGSGLERRSIPNFADLYASLRSDHGGCLSVRPETLPLARQLALFGTADIIVAQHGAALANVIWARRGATVIEIYPDDVRADFFRELAWCLGLRYRRLRQQHSHAAVDPGELREVVSDAIDHPDRASAWHLRRVAFRVKRRTDAPRAKARSFARSLVRRVES